MADDTVREVHDEGNRRSDVRADADAEGIGANGASVTKRPKVLHGATYRVETGCGHLYVTVNYDESGKMIEVLCRLGKAGGCAACLNESLGRLSTALLREGTAPEVIIKQLMGTQCPSGHSGRRSCPDALAEALKQAMKEGVQDGN